MSIPNHADVQALTPENVRSLRLPWDGRFSESELVQIAASEPRLSVVQRRTGEFLIGGFWRHREEISTILELAATASAIDLLHGFVDASDGHGVKLVVASEQAERRKRQFYAGAGFDLIEEIVVYEMARIRPVSADTRGLRFEPFDCRDSSQLDELLELDNQSFPWLWWNSAGEFHDYANAPGVEIDLGRDERGRLLAYVGTTRFRTWGHLDRIAVDPEVQGRGLGKAALDHAVMKLARAGARRVGLSTQARNIRSRQLYESYGFKRAPTHDYRIYARRTDGGDVNAIDELTG